MIQLYKEEALGCQWRIYQGRKYTYVEFNDFYQGAMNYKFRTTNETFRDMLPMGCNFIVAEIRTMIRYKERENWNSDFTLVKEYKTI